MNPLPTELRNKLERTIVEARDVAEAGAKAALEALAVHHHEPFGHMSPEERKLRNHLRARARQLGDKQNQKGDLEITHLVWECAYEHWHRMLFARFLAENDLLIEPEMNVAISLEECEELAKDEGKDLWTLASEFAQRMLPQIFRPNDPVLKVNLAREHRLKLENLLNNLEFSIFTASDSLGWVYQFWQSKRKKEVNQSGNKIGADELPAVTQLFTEPYMVSFLLDNSLGAWWAARCDAGMGRRGDGAKGIFERAETEDEIRKACAIPGVPLKYLRFVRLPSSTTTGVGDAPLPSPSGRGAGGEGKKELIPADILKNARELRKNQTDAEQFLWGLLRDHRFLGKKFRRQHPIGRHILDFYCHEEKLAIEIDGGQHNAEDQRQYDDKRTAFLKEGGIRVIRFWNNEVLQQTESVLEALYLELSNKSSPPSPLTPLPKGEGKSGGIPLAEGTGQGVAPPIFLRREGLMWTPAAGTFDNWPERLSELKVLDPCCGSGHFLVAAFFMIVPMRMELEGLSARNACDAVLRENLHGLEIDKRCVELAAFSLALTAWTYPGAGGYRPLPELNVACSGLSLTAAKEDWKEFAVDKKNLRIALDWMYDTLKDAPILGSLINPPRTDAVKIVQWEELSFVLDRALKREQTDEIHESAVVAQGLSKAAILLSAKYHWIITNVPYLALGKQDERLRIFCSKHYPTAKNDLATVFLDRCLDLCRERGTTSIVLPQNWLFLTSYKKFREMLLKNNTWHFIARLGPRAFETITGEVVKAILIILSRGHAVSNSGGLFEVVNPAKILRSVDVSESRTVFQKSEGLLNAEIKSVEQLKQLENPGSKISLECLSSLPPLEQYAVVSEGLHTGDYPRFGKKLWEFDCISNGWNFQQGGVTSKDEYSGMEHILLWENGQGKLIDFVRERLGMETVSAWIKGESVWERTGFSVGSMSDLNCSYYLGTLFTHGIYAVVPVDERYSAPIRAYCTDEAFVQEVRKLDQKVCVARESIAKVPFDLNHWTKVAEKKYPNSVPKPYSNDPTQWIFHGHPCGSVVWDEEAKWTARSTPRIDDTVLQVSVARLLSYRWPAELDAEMELADEQREWVSKCSDLLKYVDEDGIVCIPSVRGEETADSRLRALLVSAFGQDWSPSAEQELIKASGTNASNLDEWLRDHFFEQHCKLFHHRPFIWHVWDGRRRDGFHALVNYHKLAEGNGKGRQLLENLTYSYLGEWITRQKEGVKRGEGGAEDRLSAAMELQKRLIAIIEGEPPFDIFVRWKPIEDQPIGWEPDINDGVRLNIRPFLAQDIPGGRKGAGILRWKPNIKWEKDRGKEPFRSKEQYPWFWKDDEFTGDRVNDIHLTINDKQKARKEKKQT